VLNAIKGHAASPRILELPNLPDKGDVVDWLDAGGKVDELIKLTENAAQEEVSAARTKPQQNGTKRARADAAVQMTQDLIAREFVVENRHWIRFDHYRGKWYVFDKKRGIWRCDEKGSILDKVRRFCAERDSPHNPKLGRANTIRGIEDLARVDPDVATTSPDWDAYPYILGTPAGYIDLKTGIVMSADPSKMITQSTIVAVEEGEPEIWLSFLLEATGGDQEYVSYIQRALGYCLTGDIIEHILFFIHGPGGTGKTTLLKTIQEILGPYAWTAPMSMFAARRFDDHPTELAALRGRRLVTASETEQDRAWAEARIKQLTGGDPIAARFMRQDFFEFGPTHKLVIVGNHAPNIGSSGEDMRRRFHVLPFEQKPREIDKDLPANSCARPAASSAG
jgi:putative DNA primase/helicase